MSEIRKWLEATGLGQYADAFETNDIDMDLIRQIDDQALRDLGMTSAGHRLRIRNAITKLTVAPAAEANVSATTPTHEPTAASAERRQLTVMFCDLVGSTALSVRLDPEDLRGVFTAYHRCCTELVERNGGFVAKYMGDGVLAYFGYPRAYEHDAERAVRTGLALVDAVPKLATHADSPLQVRIGIATGLVVVGDLIGAGAAQEQAVVGETPNLAARLQALAEPGTVVIAASTHRLTGGLFEYRDLGTVTLKGFAENVPAWQVLGAGVAESRFEALRATTTPLIGREEETDLLMRRWERAKGSDGQVVLISGEPGIGKSRIAETVLERLRDEPHARLRYFCSPHHQDSALYPSITQLERAAGFRRGDSDERRLDKLEAVLAQATNNLSEVVPLLADLLSIPTGDRYPPLNLTPQKRKEKTLRAQLAQVEGLAAQQPVLMVFEDVHWSDPSTRESLDLLVDRVPTLRVLLIITFRPEFTPLWVGRPHVTVLSLSRLPPRQRAEMITHMTSGKALPKEIADQIVDRTDGVPLFIEELTKAVVESGILTEIGDSYALAGPVAPLAIPTSLQASLLARLDRLAPTREVAQIAATLGRQFSHELISAVAPIPQQQLDDALAQLVHAELIFRRGTPPDAEYTFKHALVQDAAYGTLLRSRRQQLHARVATTLESQFPEIAAAQPTLLAQHCDKADLIEKAIDYRLKAGQRAIEHSTMTEAEAQLRKGLDLLARMPNGTEHQQHELELDLQLALVKTLSATQGFVGLTVAQTLTRARQLCEQLDRPTQLALVLSDECESHVFRAELVLACKKSKELLDLADAGTDPALKLRSRLCCALSWTYLGEFVAARAYAEHALALCDPAHPVLWIADSQVLALMLSSSSLTILGHLDHSSLRREQAIAQARRRGHAFTLAAALATTLGQYAAIQFDPAILLQRADELAALSAEHGFAHWIAVATSWRGCCLSALGRTEEGLTVQTEALAAHRATGTLLSRPVWLTRLADAYMKAGRAKEGLKQLDEATNLVEATQERVGEAQLYRLRGDLLNATGDRAAAEQSYHQALAVAERQSAKLFELCAATSLAQLRRDQGKRTEARDLLSPIYGWFTEGFDTPVLQDAKALLDELA